MLQFKNGKIGMSTTGKIAFTRWQANKCYCCHQCKFSKKSKIQNYMYTSYIGTAPDKGPYRWQEFIGTGDFHIQPFQTCCWCQEYIHNIYDPQTQELVESNTVVGAGTQIGFCYTEWGWWDGNEAGRTPVGDVNAPSEGVYVGLDPEGGGKAVTYFSCGKCCGPIAIRYWYVRHDDDPDIPGFGGDQGEGVYWYADVSFNVCNPECCYDDTYPCEYIDQC